MGTTSCIDNTLPDYWRIYLENIRRYDHEAHLPPSNQLNNGCYQKVGGGFYTTGVGKLVTIQEIANGNNF